MLIASYVCSKRKIETTRLIYRPTPDDTGGLIGNMSRRNKNKNKERLILKGVSKTEWLLKNYLHINDIYKGNDDMQTIIINSFFNQNGGHNDAPWKEKLLVCNENFGRFAQYANTWKQSTI